MTVYEHAIEELEQKRSLIDKVIEGLKTLGHLFGAATPPLQPKAEETARTIKQSVGVYCPLCKAGPYKNSKALGPHRRACPVESAAFTCGRHPESGQTPNGKCKACKAEYQRRHYLTRKAKKKAAPVSVAQPSEPSVEPINNDLDLKPTDDLATVAAKLKQSRTAEPTNPEYLYSRPTRCPKCGAEAVRLRRLARAEPKDCWLHIRSHEQRPCTIKIAHYQIKTDAAYQPEAA